MNKEAIEIRIKEIESAMYASDFWNDPKRAQALMKEYEELKDAREGVGKYDKGGAILSIYAGAGGDDAEDFAGMLLRMYQKFCMKKNWNVHVLHMHENDHGGYRNLSIEVSGKGAYGELKHEYGVHRLVRISPFNAGGKRQTSFVLVEVLPVIEKTGAMDIPESDLDISYTKSSGPGGQNVNKRETAVRVVHIPTGVSAHVDGERYQNANKEKALAMIAAKLFTLMERERKETIAELSTDVGKIEWGSQIRSYVLHPYQLVKDHRTSIETGNVDSVLEEGDIQLFIDGMSHVG